MDPLRKLAKLVERGLRLGTARGQQRGERRVAVCLGVPVGEAQLVGECEEPLLGAVMQVALETTPLLVRDLDDARSRGAHRLELCQHLRLQALVLDSEVGRGSDVTPEVVHVEVPGEGWSAMAEAQGAADTE